MKPSKNIDELIENATQAFLEYPMDLCKKVWATAQIAMHKIIQCGGGNTYKRPHAGKDAIICSQKQDIPLRLPCQAMHTGGAIDGNVIKAYMEGGLSASNQVAPAPQVMVSGQILTDLVVPASRPAVISPTRLGGANALDLLNEAIGIREDDRMDLTDTAISRIFGMGGTGYDHDYFTEAAA